MHTTGVCVRVVGGWSSQAVILISLICTVCLQNLHGLWQTGKHVLCERATITAALFYIPSGMLGQRDQNVARQKEPLALHSTRVVGSSGQGHSSSLPPKKRTKAYMSYEPHLMKVKEWLWPWHTVSLNRSHDACGGMLGPIICTQGNIYSLTKRPNRFDLLGLSREYTINFTHKWNLKQNLKLQTQKTDLKNPLNSVKSS